MNLDIKKDISIKICNRTPVDLRFVIFQQDPDIPGMFQTIYPVAWMSLILAGSLPRHWHQGGVLNCTYPASIQLGVNEHLPERPLKEPPHLLETIKNQAKMQPSQQMLAMDDERFTLVDAAPYQCWEFSCLPGKKPELNVCPGKNSHPVVTCLNTCQYTVDISLCKNGLPLHTAYGVSQGEKVDFSLTPRLWVMYSDDVEQGAKISRYIATTNAQEINLKGITGMSLSLHQFSSGEKVWALERRS